MADEDAALRDAALRDLVKRYWELPKAGSDHTLTRDVFDRGEVIPLWAGGQTTKSLPAVDLLVSLTGFSPNTTLYCVAALRPKAVLVVHTSESVSSYNIIHGWTTEHLKLPASNILPIRVEGAADASYIYRRVRARLQERSGEVGEVVFDITGGTSVMSAAASLAAWQLDVRVCYLESERRERDVIPGSQRLVLLDSPSKLLGVDLCEQAAGCLRDGRFQAARAAAEGLTQRSGLAQRGRFLMRLADLYDAWSSLDVQRLEVAIPAMRLEGSFASNLPADDAERLEEQLEFAQRLANRDEDALLLNHFILGQHYHDQGRFELSALLFYRAMEGCFVHRLRQVVPQAFSRQGTKIVFDAGRLEAAALERFAEVAQSLFKAEDADLPQRPHARLGFLDSAVLLHALADPLLRRAGFKERRSLGRLRTLADVRNHSLLAHGFNAVTEKQSSELSVHAGRLLRELERLGSSTPRLAIEERVAALTFLKPS